MVKEITEAVDKNSHELWHVESEDIIDKVEDGFAERDSGATEVDDPSVGKVPEVLDAQVLHL